MQDLGGLESDAALLRLRIARGLLRSSPTSRAAHLALGAVDPAGLARDLGRRRIARSQHMAIDTATRDSLEICRTQTGNLAGSLLATVDRCVTAPGRRLLASDLSAPLTDARSIEARLAEP